MAGMSFDCQFFVEIRKHTEQRHWNVWNGEYCAMQFRYRSESCIAESTYWSAAAVVEDAMR